MTRHEGDIVSERPELLADRANQIGMIAARKIGAADRARKQHISNQRDAMRAAKEDHMARRMPRAVINLERLIAELNRVAVLQPAVRFERLRCREAETRALGGQLIDPETLVGMRAVDRDAVVRGQGFRAGAMIDVTVREENLFDRYVLPLDLILDDLEIAAWIDNGGASRRLANEQRAVLLERGDGDQSDFHEDGGPQQKR